MQRGHNGMSQEPRKHNTPKDQVAERLNLTEGRRLNLQTRYYMHQKQNAEHIMNQKIHRVSEVLDHISLSSGSLGGQEFISEEVTAPCFMYGERVESRRRYSKRMALLRYFLERRPKSPQGLGRVSMLGEGKREVDKRSADEIFQEILDRIESDSEEEDNEKLSLPNSNKQKEVKVRCSTAVVTGSPRIKLSPTRGGGTKPRPRTAPCWESSKPFLSPGGNSIWTTSTSSVQDIGSLSPQILLENGGGSPSRQDAYIPFWADMDPVNRGNMRLSRGKSHSIVSSTSSIHGSPRHPKETLQQISMSSISSAYSSSSGRARNKHPSSSPRRTLPSEQSLRVDAFFSPRPKSSVSSRLTQDDEKKTVDAYFKSSDNPASPTADLEGLVLPSLPTRHTRSFKRPTIYAPTIASRQRTISSMMVSAGKRRISVSS